MTPAGRCIRTYGLIAIAVIVVACIVSYSRMVRSHWLSFVPDDFGVTRILYTQEDSWGFGPGGNETGIVVYELPAAVAADIQKRGMPYLASLHQGPRSPDDYWHGRYEEWHRTPLCDENWMDRDGMHGPVLDPYAHKVWNYMDRYGFGLRINQDIEQLVDSAVSKPGSFFAYGRIGMLIVIPEAERAVYVYNG